MTMTAREAFERGTVTFNSHDIDGFAEVLANDVVFETPGGLRGQGKASCIEFYGSWFGAFPDAQVDVHCLHIIGDVAVEEGTFTGTHNGVLKGPMGEAPTDRSPHQNRLYPGAPFSGRQACLVQLDVRPAFVARAARPHSCTTTHGQVRHLGQARRMSSVRRSSP
jgi:hypothetical protein